MMMLRWFRYALLLLALGAGVAHAQSSSAVDAVLLVASPQFRDPTYHHTVLIAAPLDNGGHIGVILNRPTTRSLSSLFPEHEPSKKVADPVFFGGPFSRSALVAVVRRDSSPGQGSLPLMKSLYLAINVGTIDQIIESTPNDARYYVGYVGWRPGELRREIDRGMWSVLNADPKIVFRKDTDGLWEELLRMSRQITASFDGDETDGASRL
jgi:putative transcriptional regulator